MIAIIMKRTLENDVQREHNTERLCARLLETELLHQARVYVTKYARSRPIAAAETSV